jgi:uncharacterized membrane protein
MKTTRGAKRLLSMLAVLTLLALSSLALAGPRSGGSFGGRLGFRSGGGSSMPRSYSSPGYSGGGSHFIFAPGWGWGWGGGGYGYGGGLGIFGTLLVIAVVGYGAFAVSRAIRRARQGGAAGWQGGYQSGYGDSYDDEVQSAQGRAYVYKLQIGLGRSARGIQQRLEQFATSGDTSTEAGLAALLQQSALELLRQKDSIRYAGADASGPMSLTNAETKMNGLALAERSRFEVERVRSADGRVNRAQESAIEGAEALEIVLVTMIVATRTPLSAFKTIGSHQELETLLSELGGVAPGGLLGLEVVWTPADPDDSMTETDLMTTYPELRSL